jgi:hypothetical protein
MNDLHSFKKMRKNYFLIFFCISIILLNVSCSAILAPKVLNVECRYHCDSEYLVKGSVVCNVQLTNKDDFDWHNITLIMNDNYGYSVKIPVLKAGDTYSANFSDFILKDGTRFDIKSTKPLRITINCKEGTNQGEWN